MTQKLVSVIIPNYNGLEFIKETLNSVYKQTHKEIEVIVVDDGSTDGSFEYLSKVDKPNFRLLKNPSKGACAARNYGLSLATGDYIQFLDADDLLDLNKIEAQLQQLSNDENKVAVCSTRHFYENPQNGVITDTPFLFSTNKPQDFLLKLYGSDGQNHNMVAQHAWLSPKSVIDSAGLWDENLIKDQDGEFFCRVVMASHGICYAENVLCYYRKHRQKSNISGGKSENHLLSQFKALNSKSHQLRTSKDTKAYKNAMALQYKLIAIDAFPEYKDIYAKSLKLSNDYGGSNYVPVLGGKLIEFSKTALGWKFAKLFRLFLHKIKNALK
ncbi:glycosyltransferase family 2 protein [Winogradskyella forsetii]|uniref:glycosyltransferase family 2 protein n=1 Tax=Winogradskyella forsetii TaxID=2686077 RepID=UPI0015B8CF87|nr:glycosyltransferase family 2 protein [Winogradskyella forsetii]